MEHLAICTIVKNEARYIVEWLSYHHFIGVQSFYIYNNQSTDSTIALIHSWPYRHRVHIIDWPGNGVQLSAYQHMIDEHRDAAAWCAFIDVDEFLCPTTSQPVPDILRDMSDDCTGLYVHWMIFGSSGHRTRQRGLVTETFIRRGWDDFEPNGVGKSIVRLQFAAAPFGVHIIQSNGRLINDSGHELAQDQPGLYAAVCSHRKLSLNHYFTKSLEEWHLRRGQGRATKPADAPDFCRPEADFWAHDANDVVDTRAADIMRACRASYDPRTAARLFGGSG